MQKICLTVLAQLPIVAPRCPPSGQAAKQYGEVSEWLKEHAWKVCIRQRIGGSNPPLTAIFKTKARTKVRAFFFYIFRKGGMRAPRATFSSVRPEPLTLALSPKGRGDRYSSTIRAYSSVRKSTSVLTDGSKPRRDGYTAWITSRLGSQVFSTRTSFPDAS